MWLSTLTHRENSEDAVFDISRVLIAKLCGISRAAPTPRAQLDSGQPLSAALPRLDCETIDLMSAGL
jgi:hypothetical protein